MGPTEYSQWRRRRVDRAIGIALGIVLGIVVVIVFVFYGSGEVIDAPSIDEADRPPVERQEPGRNQRRR
jgi:hypothetical protein